MIHDQEILYSPRVERVSAATADGAGRGMLVQVGLGWAVLARLTPRGTGSGAARGTGTRDVGRLGGRVRVEHPPAGLAGALVLHAHELAVQRQVVPDGVLKCETD